MAELHNLAIGAIRLAGRTDITEATGGLHAYGQALTILGLTT